MEEIIDTSRYTYTTSSGENISITGQVKKYKYKLLFNSQVRQQQ